MPRISSIDFQRLQNESVGKWVIGGESPYRASGKRLTCPADLELAPGEHHYRFLVDGQWRDDPQCALHVPNPYGSQDAVRQVA